MVGGCGWLGLGLTLPNKNLRITGAPRSVFSVIPPAGLEQAALLFKQKKWEELEAELEKYVKKGESEHPTSNTQHPTPNRFDTPDGYARELLAKYREQERHVGAMLKLIEEDVTKGHKKLAQVRLSGLERLLGEVSPAMVELKTGAAALTNDTLELPKGFVNSTLDTMDMGPGADMYRPLPARDPKAPPLKWELVLPWATPWSRGGYENAKPGDSYIATIVEEGEPDPDLGDWTGLDYDAGGWEPAKGFIAPVSGKKEYIKGRRVWIRRNFKTPANAGDYERIRLRTGSCATVYLNGHCLATLVRRGDMELQPKVLELLKKDGTDNVVAAYFPWGKKRHDLVIDAAVEAVPVEAAP